MIEFRNENENSARNFNSVSIGSVTFYFSYQTCVAVRVGWSKLYVCKNVWGSTTGKHLNWVDGGNKENRIDYDKFKEILEVIEGSFDFDVQIDKAKIEEIINN